MESQDQIMEDVVKSVAKKHTTPNGKEIQVVRDAKNSNYLKIQFATGGEIPNDLAGLFTSYRLANIAIDKYLQKKKA